MATFISNGTPITSPSPQYDIPLVSNNGVLKARHQSGLPLGYTLLEYIESTGAQYIDTGIKGNMGVKADLDFSVSNAISTNFLLAARKIAGQDTRFYLCTFSNQGVGQFDIALGKDAFSPEVVANQRYNYVMDTTVSPATLVIDGGQTITNNNSYDTNLNMYLFASNTAGEASFGGATPIRIYYAKIWEGNTLVRDFVPAKNSSNIVGMYDLVSGQFFTNAGTGDFVAGTAVSDPVEIYTDGTVETIKDSLNNTATAEMLLKVGDYQDVQSIIDGVVTRNVGVKVLDGSEDWETTGQPTVYRWVSPVPFSLPNIGICSHYVGVSTNSTVADMPGMSMKTGSITASNIYIKDSSFGNNLAGFKQYLADQYNAGTPVIVIYPLATPTTESVAGQTLQVQAGDNTLEITQASLSGLELEAEYQKGVL